MTKFISSHVHPQLLHLSVVIVWVMTLCGTVSGYQHFGGVYRLHLHDRFESVWAYNLFVSGGGRPVPMLEKEKGGGEESQVTERSFKEQRIEGGRVKVCGDQFLSL